jgi:hypothetical protein
LSRNPVLGLYDQQGLLRFSGRDQADCLAYAELFGLPQDSFSLESLVHEFAVEAAGAQLSLPS